MAEGFLTIRAGIIQITSDVRALAWLKKEERKKKERRKKKNKLAFWLVAGFLPWLCWRAILALSLGRAALEKDRKALQSVQQ